MLAGEVLQGPPPCMRLVNIMVRHYHLIVSPGCLIERGLKSFDLDRCKLGLFAVLLVDDQDSDGH